MAGKPKQQNITRENFMSLSVKCWHPRPCIMTTQRTGTRFYHVVILNMATLSLTIIFTVYPGNKNKGQKKGKPPPSKNQKDI